MVPIWVAMLEKAPAMVDDVVVVTGGADSHRTRLHPHFRALDIRISNIEAPNDGERWEEALAWGERMARRLGPDYDVVTEDDHIHVECDPKGV